MFSRPFTHIYVEKQSLPDEVTESVLERFPKADHIVIEDYREIFHRSKQNWDAQKRSKQLILARKKTDFLYPATEIAPSFGFENFYYNSFLMNCLYDCSYCYLQGMYASAFPVLFTNLQDYFRETVKVVQKESPLYLCISYDSDVLAFESLYPYARKWIEFTNAQEGLLIELRTKSAAFAQLADLSPSDRVVLAWTLSPQKIIDEYEQDTPPLKARLAAAAAAVERGWKIRLCFDPLLLVEGWQEIYSDFFEEVFSVIDASALRDISCGFFRMNESYFKQARKKHQRTDMYLLDWEKRAGIYQESPQACTAAKSWVESRLRSFLPSETKLVFTLPEDEQEQGSAGCQAQS